MTLEKKYIGAYSHDARDYFTLLSTEQEVVKRLKNIYRNEKGIFILCGNRGSGKSSLKNISLEPEKYYRSEDKRILVINVSFFSGNKDFYREILMQTSSAIEKSIKETEDRLYDIVNNKQKMYLVTPASNMQGEVKEYSLSESYQIENRVSNFYKTIKKIKNKKKLNLQSLCDQLFKEIQELDKEFGYLNEQYGFQKGRWSLFKNNRVNISKLRKNIDELDKKINNFEKASIGLERMYEFFFISQEQLNYFDVEITDTKKYLETTTSEVSAESSIDLSTDLGIVTFGTQLKGNLGFNESEELSRELRSVVTEELKERQLLRLFKNMSEYFDITFSIDELDKCSASTIVDIIDKNKRLFFDCNVSVLLITDVSTAILLEEKSDYISEPNIIVVPDLTIMEYIYRINSKGLPLNNHFIDILDSYFRDKMNNRELNYSKNILFTKSVINRNFSKGFELYKFMNTSVYQSLNKWYQAIVLKFYWELLELLDLVGELSRDEYELFESSFFEKNELSSLKIKFIIKRIVTQMITRTFEYGFSFANESSLFIEELDKSSYEKQQKIAEFLHQLAARPTILSDYSIFLKINNKDIQTDKLYNFKREFSDYLSSLGFNDEIFGNMLLHLSKTSVGGTSNNKDYILSKLKNLYSISNNTTDRFADKFYNPSRGIDDARDIVRRENTVGVILFYPYDYSENADSSYKPLQNGIIVTVNDFDEVVLYPYVGYIGLHSHKPSRLKEFKKELEKQNIPIYEVENEVSWKKCFEKDNKELEEKIKEVCGNNMDVWIDELRKIYERCN